jgi:nucleoporin NUP159
VPSSTTSTTDASKPASTGFGGSSSSTPAPTQSPFGAPAAAASTFKVNSGFGAFSNQNTSSSFSAFSNPKTADTQAKSLNFAGNAAQPSATTGTTKSGSDTPTTTNQPKFGQSAFGQSSFGQSSFGQSAFGQSSFGQSAFGAAKSPFAPAATSAPRASSGTGGGFSAFASSGSGFGSLASVKSDSKTPAYLQGSSDNLKPTTEPALSTSQKDGTGTAPKSVFGSNAAVSQPGFGGRGVRVNANKDEEDEDAGSKEKFPEEDADKLEPVTRYDGPGLFAATSSQKGRASSGLGGLDLKEQKASASVPSGTQSAFGKTISSSDAAASAAAAFKPTQPAAASSTTPKSSPTPTAPTPSLLSRLGPPRAESAFASASTKEKSSTEKPDQEEHGSEEEPEGSLEDDVDDFLEDDGLEIHEYDEDDDEGEEDEEEEEEEEEEEDEEEEEEEEEDASAPLNLPEIDDDTRHTRSSPVLEKKGQQAQSSANSKPTTVAPPFNPFGRGANSVAAEAPSTSRGTDASRGALDQTTERDPGKVQPAPLSSQPKPKPASPKAPFGSWQGPPTSASSTNTDLSKTVKPNQPPSFFGQPAPKPSSSGQGVSTSTIAPATGRGSVAHSTPPPYTPLPPNNNTRGSNEIRHEVTPVQPKHPELQAQLDRLLHEYSVILFQVRT